MIGTIHLVGFGVWMLTSRSIMYRIGGVTVILFALIAAYGARR